MASETEISTAVVAIKADLSQLLASMKKVSPEAAAMTKDLVSAVSKELKHLEKAHEKTNAKVVQGAKNAAKATGRSWNDIAKSMQSNQMISDLEQIGSMFSLVGGNVSKAAMIFTSSVRPLAMLAEVLGPSAPLALGLAALPLAGVAVVKVFQALADGAVEATDRLDKMGRAAEVPAEARRAMRDYEVAAQELQVTMDSLAVTIGSAVMPEVTRLTTATRILLDYAIEGQNGGGPYNRLFGIFPLPDDPVLDGIADMSDRAHEFSTSMSEVIKILSTGGASVLIDQLSVAINGLVDAETRATTAAENMRLQRERDLDLIQAQLEAEDKYKQSHTDAAAVAKAKGDAAAVANRREADAERELAKAKRDTAAADRERAKATRDFVAEFELFLEEEEYAARLLDQQRKEGIEDYTAKFERSIDIVDAAALAYRDLNRELQGVEQAFAELAAKQLAMRDAFIGIANDTISVGQDVTASILSGFEQRVAAGEQLTAKEKKAAMAAFRVQQGLAIASAQLAAIQAAATTVAQLTAVAVPFPLALVAGVAAAAAIEASMVSQLVNMEPPEFPTGRSGSPDHQTVRVRPDEPILTPRAGRELGADTIDALNQGQVGALGSGTLTVYLQVDREVIGEAVARVSGGQGRGVIRASRGKRSIYGSY